jgi:sulfite reductase (ferredoxin)
VEKFREVLEKEYLGRELVSCESPASPVGHRDHVGVHEQKDGRFYIGVTPIVGRVSGSTLAKLADLIEAHGSARLRTTPHQKIVILDVPAQNVEPFVAELDALGLQARPSLIRRGTIACTGIEFCKLAIVETKVNATAAVLDLEERLKGFELPHPISLHVNGCPNSCARIQTADIGLKGQLVTIDGEQVPGYQVHLGGGLASRDRDEPGLGRTVRGLKVAADGIADYVERVVTRFLADREADETFAGWAHRAEEEALQ